MPKSMTDAESVELSVSNHVDGGIRTYPVADTSRDHSSNSPAREIQAQGKSSMLGWASFCNVRWGSSGGNA